MTFRRVLRMALLAPACLLVGSYYSSTLTVTTSGTARPLSAATPTLPENCVSVNVTWVSTNSGTIYIGGSNVSAANKIGTYINSSFPAAYFSPAAANPMLALATIYVDAATSGDKVSVQCVR